MSVSTSEEDTELRDLVAATLQQTGILGNIKALDIIIKVIGHCH